MELATTKGLELGVNPQSDRVWFVIDTDRWRVQLNELRHECIGRQHWRVAQSNPCFEVWLYYHVKATLPVLNSVDQCNNWKPHLQKIIKRGFNPDFHTVAIETAIINAKNLHRASGYSPLPGSTQLWELGEELLPLKKRILIF